VRTPTSVGDPVAPAGPRHRRVFLVALVVFAMAVIAGPAWAFIHYGSVDSFTIRHGLFRGDQPRDGDMQVSTNQSAPASSGSQIGSRLRIGLAHLSNEFYEYVCSDTFACYHNHHGGYPECQYRPINGFRHGDSILGRHSHADSDYPCT
jgi:hypothetical protein